MKQEALRERLLLELDLLTVDVTEVARDLTAVQVAWTPPAGGWGIGHVLEHLCLVADSYFTTLRPAIYRAGTPVAPLGRNQWDPTWMGGLLVSSLRSRRRFRTPKIWQVGPEPRTEVLRAFLERQQTQVTLMRAAATLDWNRVRFHSPASRFLRLNLGDAFTALIVHGQRHVQQMERIRAQPQFPA